MAAVVPEYLRTAEAEQAAVRDFMDYGIQLGRRFRALKLWMVIRYFGGEGLAARIREHIRLGHLFASWRSGMLISMRSTSGCSTPSTPPAAPISPTPGCAAASPCGWPWATCAPRRRTCRQLGTYCRSMPPGCTRRAGAAHRKRQKRPGRDEPR